MNVNEISVGGEILDYLRQKSKLIDSLAELYANPDLDIKSEDMFPLYEANGMTPRAGTVDERKWNLFKMIIFPELQDVPLFIGNKVNPAVATREEVVDMLMYLMIPEGGRNTEALLQNIQRELRALRAAQINAAPAVAPRGVGVHAVAAPAVNNGNNNYHENNNNGNNNNGNNNNNYNNIEIGHTEEEEELLGMLSTKNYKKYAAKGGKRNTRKHRKTNRKSRKSKNNRR